MKFSILAIAAAVGVASAQHAIVNNHCDETIWVESFPYNDDAPGVLYALKKGESFSEAFRYSGTSVKIAKEKTFTKPLLFGYSFSDDRGFAYYEFSDKFGNPFADKRNKLSPGPGCKYFDCAANDGNCYSHPGDMKVYGCPQPVNLVADICA